MFFICTVPYPALRAQPSNTEIKSYIQKLESGRTEEVKNALPDLITKYQNTSDILYLQGRLASDGIEAAKFYQGVVDNFPKSEWADDALYRIYQYYYALGLYRTAGLKLEQLKKQYPNSIHVTGKPPVQLPEQEEAVLVLPKKETTAVETPAPPSPGKSTQDSAGADGASARSTPESGAVDVAPSGSYTLQVGAFSTLVNAEKQKSFFEDRGYTAEITNKVRGGRSLHLVWVGNFRSAQEALRTGKEVKAKFKMESIVVERY